MKFSQKNFTCARHYKCLSHKKPGGEVLQHSPQAMKCQNKEINADLIDLQPRSSTVCTLVERVPLFLRFLKLSLKVWLPMRFGSCFDLNTPNDSKNKFFSKKCSNFAHLGATLASNFSLGNDFLSYENASQNFLPTGLARHTTRSTLLEPWKHAFSLIFHHARTRWANRLSLWFCSRSQNIQKRAHRKEFLQKRVKRYFLIFAVLGRFPL